MKRKRHRTMTKYLGLIGTIILLFPSTVFAAEESTSLASKAGWMTLIPPVVAIVLAFATKNVLLSLFLGVFSGTILIELLGGAALFSAFTGGFMSVVQHLLESLADPWNAGIVLQVLTIGGLINLITNLRYHCL